MGLNWNIFLEELIRSFSFMAYRLLITCYLSPIFMHVHMYVFIKDRNSETSHHFLHLLLYHLKFYNHRYDSCLVPLQAGPSILPSNKMEQTEHGQLETVSYSFLHTTFFCYLSTTCSHEINISKLQHPSNDLKDISNFFLCETHHLHGILTRTMVKDYYYSWDYQGPCSNFASAGNNNQLKQFLHCRVLNW